MLASKCFVKLFLIHSTISQNIDFDDDEDDYNMEDDNAGMPLFSNLNSVSPTSVDGTHFFFSRADAKTL